jgi:hypothetical protein
MVVGNLISTFIVLEATCLFLASNYRQFLMMVGKEIIAIQPKISWKKAC